VKVGVFSGLFFFATGNLPDLSSSRPNYPTRTTTTTMSKDKEKKPRRVGKRAQAKADAEAQGSVEGLEKAAVTLV
jgi:hypothetical protein